MADIWAELAKAHDDCFALILAKLARQVEQLQGFLEGECRDRLILLQCCKSWLIDFGSSTDLHHRSEARDLDAHCMSRLWILAKDALACFLCRTFFDGAVDERMEDLIERSYTVGPAFFAFSYLVELILDIGCKVVIDDIWEMRHEEVVDHNSDVGRQELALFHTYGF